VIPAARIARCVALASVLVLGGCGERGGGGTGGGGDGGALCTAMTGIYAITTSLHAGENPACWDLGSDTIEWGSSGPEWADCTGTNTFSEAGCTLETVVSCPPQPGLPDDFQDHLEANAAGNTWTGVTVACLGATCCTYDTTWTLSAP
jgi:hypothetical protein